MPVRRSKPSTGKLAKSTSPNPPVDTDQADLGFDDLEPVPEPQLVDHPEPPYSPQVRDFSLVTSRSAFEQQILSMLEDEFERLDDIARAASRFERQTLERLKSQRLAEGYAPDDAGELTSIFDVKDFTAKAEHLVDLSALGRIIGMLGLGQYRDEIMLRLISDRFGPSPKTKETTSVYLGSYEQAQARELRKKK